MTGFLHVPGVDPLSVGGPPLRRGTRDERREGRADRLSKSRPTVEWSVHAGGGW